MGFTLTNVSKDFYSKQGQVSAIRDVSITAADEEFVCIVGPSGCGKTTLLKIVAGLVKPDSGRIKFSTPLESNQIRSAMVFQELGLYPWLNLLDNVCFGLEARGVARTSRHERGMEMLKRLGLAKFAGSFPHELSGGMKQRAAIIRAFLCEPQILLMDEPFSSLDSQTRLIMQDELLFIWKEFRHTVLYVTHDIEEAILLGDRVLVMTGRPSSIRTDIKVDLPRPRHIADRSHPEIIDLRHRIWKMLEEEVRKEVGVISR